MKEICSFETTADFQRTMLRYIQKYQNLNVPVLLSDLRRKNEILPHNLYGRIVQATDVITVNIHLYFLNHVAEKKHLLFFIFRTGL
jgi:hypothetical protein